jgi:hypothetical protein
MSERAYFDPPALDRVLSLVLQLAEDLHVTRHRLRALEELLAAQGVIAAGALDRPALDEAALARLDADRDAFLARLMRVMSEHGPSEHPLRDEAPTGSGR